MGDESILETISEFPALVSTIDDEINDEFEHEQDGRTIRGLQCSHGNNPYLIYGVEGWQFVQVQFQYNVINDYIVANLDDLDEAEEFIIIHPDEESDFIEEARTEMMEFLNSIEDNLVERFHIDVLQQLKNNSLAYEIQTVNGNRITGFQVSGRLFPLENAISAKEFHDTVQAVMSIGVPLRAYIQYSYGLRQYSGESSYMQSMELI